MLGYLFLISALLGLGSPLIRTGWSTQWLQFSNTVITTNVLSVSDNVRSGLRCVMLCLEIQVCVSVFYRQVVRRCQFHDVLFLSSQDGEEENGTKYYSLTTGSCPSGYINNRLQGLCYQQHLNKILYDDCVADCASRSEHLIIIDSQEKQDQVKKQITSSSGGMVSSYFIDGSDAVTEGLWLFHDGRTMNFFAWGADFPKNLTTERDYLVASKANGDFLWQDRKKAETKYYMCEKDMI